METIDAKPMCIATLMVGDVIVHTNSIMTAAVIGIAAAKCHEGMGNMEYQGLQIRWEKIKHK